MPTSLSNSATKRPALDPEAVLALIVPWPWLVHTRTPLSRDSISHQRDLPFGLLKCCSVVVGGSPPGCPISPQWRDQGRQCLTEHRASVRQSATTSQPQATQSVENCQVHVLQWEPPEAQHPCLTRWWPKEPSRRPHRPSTKRQRKGQMQPSAQEEAERLGVHPGHP